MAEKILNNLLEKYESLSNIKCNNKSLSAIKSNIMFHYMQRAMSLSKSDLLESIFSSSERCQWCLNKWTEGKISMELKPERHPKSSLCRLFNKNRSKLNKYQSKLVLKYKIRWRSNALKLLCSTCRKKTTIYIAKPRKSLRPKPSKKSPTDKQTIKKIKKNKKKDVYAGLKRSVFTGPLSKNMARKHNYKGTSRPTYQYNKVRTNVCKQSNRTSKGSHNHNIVKKNSVVQDFLQW